MNNEYASSDTLIVALDMGKNVHWLGCYDGRLNELVAPHKLRSDLEGFQQFRARVDPLLTSGRFQRALMGNEPTGVYHKPWAWHIRQSYLDDDAWSACPVEYHWINPLLTKRRHEQHTIRRRSNDKTSVVAVASCLADGDGYPAYFPSIPEAQLQQLERHRSQLASRQRYLANQIICQADCLWPGAMVNVKRFGKAHPELEPPTPIVQTKALDRERVAAFFLHCPNPHDVLALGVEGLIAFLRRYVGRCGPKTANRILSMLRRAPLPPPELADIYAQRLQADYQTYHRLGGRISALEGQIESLVPETDAHFLASVPGISPLLATRYCTAIGSVVRFPSAGHIWSFAGFDLVTEGSGDSQRLGKITKRGSSSLRETLFLIGHTAAQNCPPIGHTYLDARERGLSKVPATIHAAHKVNRLCFTLLNERRPYRPVTDEQRLAFKRRWQAFHAKSKRKRRRPRKKAAC